MLLQQCRNIFNSDESPKVEGLYDAVSRISHLTAKLNALSAYAKALDDILSGNKYIKPQYLENVE